MPRAFAIFIVVIGLAVPASAQPAAEVERVRAHLVAARSFVEARDVSALTPQQRTQRTAALAILDAYIARGVFPVRGADGYGELQPRFIDARGVHCAVGEMIAQTGHADLAQAINRDFEYAKVVDIHSSALLAWANDYGFTVNELARIQPGYSSPPTETSVRHDIERQSDEAMLACASSPPPSKARIRMICSRDGDVRLQAPDDATDFERCFAGAVEPGRYGGAMDPSPTAFDHTISVTLRTPRQVLDARLNTELGLAPQCSPRPGPLARTATLSVTNSADDELKINVTTTPANPQIARCIQAYLAPPLHDFRSVGNFTYARTWDVSHMTSQAVQTAATRLATGFATDCYDRETAPAKLSLAIVAQPDDETFVISAKANAAYAKCVADKLAPALRKHFTVTREVGGNPQPYFRIDNAVDARVSFTVELPVERAARLERERKKEEALRAALEKQRQAEMRRQQYE
ncbi:MAG TPA: hypothetical protein VGM90_29110 [Kofleriaceae bacterium]|jgi:hypothetical protein